MSERTAARTAAPRTAVPVRPALTPASSLLLQRTCACGQVPGSGGKCVDCEKKEKKKVVQRAASGVAPATVPPIVNQALSSGGHPLDRATRSFMESRFGRDFSAVRVHDDATAAESARAVNARAYTVGQDIVFDQGRYRPETDAGRHLIAHELAHTVQQQGIQRAANGLRMGGSADSALEREAESAAAAVIGGGPVQVSRPAGGPLLSRASEGTTTPAKKKKKVTIGKHHVTPQETFTAGEDSIEAFDVEPFFLPGTKGPAALEAYKSMADAGSLETVVAIQGSGRTKTALWQKRESTADLRDLWLQKVGWPKTSASDLWERSGGDKTFPDANGQTCQMDHIVELQVGGTNPPENIQPLNPGPNRESGGDIKTQIETLAKAVAAEPTLSGGEATQYKFHFTRVTPVGTPEKPSASCPPPKGKARSCLAVEACARKLKIEKTPEGGARVARADYPITAGGRNANLRVTTTFATSVPEIVPLETDPENAGAATVIPGLLLTQLYHQKGKTKKPDFIDARIDDRDKTRLPISLNKDAPGVKLIAGADGDLKLDPAAKKKRAGIAFTYKYLSPGTIDEIAVDEAGEASWKGTIKPSVPFLGALGVEYAKNQLLVTKGLDEATLKKLKVLGMRVTKAQVEMQLAPEFKPRGVVELQLGSEAKPLAKAELSIESDSIGLVAKGKLNVNIPKMQTAETAITYRGGADRNEWDAKIHIRTEDIKLGPKVSVTGGFDGNITKDGLDFTGKIEATFFGENKADLELDKRGADWVLRGGGTFKFPKLDDTRVRITYYLDKDLLVATGSTGFTIPSIGFRGRLDEITFVVDKGESLKVKEGKGGFDFKKGKAEGHVDVKLHPNGKFSGKGSLSYAIKENIIVTGTVELNEQEKLRVTGELLITRYELFKRYGDKKDLFTLDIPVPIPGLSIGTSGIVFAITGGVSAEYGFGPGVIEPLKFTAGFDPLEADPDLELAVSGTVKVPASATLSASIAGELRIQVDVVVGSAGVAGGVKLTGDIILSAGAFAQLDAAYKKKRLTAKVVAGIEAKLLLGLALTAYVRAWAGAFGLKAETRKDWTLAKKTIDTGLGFYLSAPFEYADDTGIKLPEMKDVTLRKPDVTVDNMKRILGEIFSSSNETVKES